MQKEVEDGGSEVSESRGRYWRRPSVKRFNMGQQRDGQEDIQGEAVGMKGRAE